MNYINTSENAYTLKYKYVYTLTFAQDLKQVSKIFKTEDKVLTPTSLPQIKHSNIAHQK